MIGVDQTNQLESIYENFTDGNKEDVVALIDAYGVDFWEDWQDYVLDIVGTEAKARAGVALYGDVAKVYHLIKAVQQAADKSTPKVIVSVRAGQIDHVKKSSPDIIVECRDYDAPEYEEDHGQISEDDQGVKFVGLTE
jgi:hypothetical protein